MIIHSTPLHHPLPLEISYQTFLFLIIDGHGVGVGGGAPMHDEQKLPDTRREKIQGGVHPRVRSTREKIFLTPR